MYYYNPYFLLPSMTQAMSPSSTGILGSIFKNGINWGSILNNVQRALGVANQAIPLIQQVSPVVKNAKTMFKVMNEFKKIDTPSTDVSEINNATSTNVTNTVPSSNIVEATNGPTFFA